MPMKNEVFAGRLNCSRCGRAVEVRSYKLDRKRVLLGSCVPCKYSFTLEETALAESVDEKRAAA
jgi:hypothetical protein